MKKLILFVFILLSTLTATDLQACSIIGFDFPDAICNYDQESVFTGKILQKGQYYADIQILEKHRGCETPATIRIWDGEIIDCNGPFMAPAAELGEIGDSVIFLAQKIDTLINPWDRMGDYRRPIQFGFQGYQRIINGSIEFRQVTIDGEIGRFDEVSSDVVWSQITTTTTYEEFLQILSADYCLDNTINCGFNDALFDDYPWLADLVDRNTCTTDQIELYSSGIYQYLLVTDASGNSKLYNQNGQFYCQNSANYDCVAVYNLGTPIASWTCSDSPSGDCLTDEEMIRTLRALEFGEPTCKVDKIFKIEYNGTIFYEYTPGGNCSTIDIISEVVDCRGGAPDFSVCPRESLSGCILQDEGVVTQIWTAGGNCLSEDEIIQQIQLLDPAVAKIWKFESNGSIYYSYIRLASVQDYVGATVDCRGDIVCVNSILPINPTFCIALEGEGKIEIWSVDNEEGECLTEAEIIQKRLEREFGDCKVANIFKIEYNGSLFYEYILGVTENCVVNDIGLVDCRGQIPCGNNGASPLCTNRELGERTRIWSLDNINIPPMFITYPWLLDIVDPNNCSIDGITVYQQGIYSYLLIADKEGGAILYNQDGQLYCRNSNNYDCVAAYNLTGNLTDFWICNPEPNCIQVVVCGVDGNLYPTPCAAAEAGVEASPDLSPCQQNMDCNQFRGTVLQDACGNYLIKVGDERISPNFQPGPQPGIPIDRPQPGDIIEFNYSRQSAVEIICEGKITQAVWGSIECFEVVDGIICAQVPVCGVDGKTYGNACAAIIADVEIDPTGTACANNNILEVIEISEAECISMGGFTVTISTRQPIIEGVGVPPYRFYSEEGSPFKFDSRLSQFGGMTLSFDSSLGNEFVILVEDETNPTNRVRVVRTIPTCERSVFEDYQWLNDLVDATNCTTEKVEVYQSGIYNYVLLTDANGKAVLYNHFGQFYCQNSATYDCVAAYGLGAPTSTWSCRNTTASCATTGTIFFENCDNGQLYYFVKTDDGKVYDPYFDSSITYTPVDGERIRFDFVDANFTTPCSKAEKAIILNCLEVLEEENNQACFQVDEEVTWATFFTSPCDTGPPLLLITNRGVVFEPYFSDGSFTPKAGQYIKADFRALRIPSLCSFAQQPVAIECIEELEPPFPTSTDCNQFTGEVELGTCNDGSEVVYIRTSPVDRFLVFLTEGLAFDFVDGQRVQFDYNGGTRFNTPCSNSTRAGFITCIQAVGPIDEGTIGEAQLEDYPFLQSAINQYGCNGIEVFDQGSYDFVFLRLGPDRGRLYLDTGIFYCETTPTYDCISAYGLGNPTSTFSCSNFDNAESEERTATSYNPFDFKAFPNPTTGQLTIQLPPASTSDYQLYIHDMLGRRMYQNEVNQTATSIELDMVDYENGVYYIELRAVGMRGIQKVVKQGVE